MSITQTPAPTGALIPFDAIALQWSAPVRSGAKLHQLHGAGFDWTGNGTQGAYIGARAYPDPKTGVLGPTVGGMKAAFIHQGAAVPEPVRAAADAVRLLANTALPALPAPSRTKPAQQRAGIGYLALTVGSRTDRYEIDLTTASQPVRDLVAAMAMLGKQVYTHGERVITD